MTTLQTTSYKAPKVKAKNVLNLRDLPHELQDPLYQYFAAEDQYHEWYEDGDFDVLVPAYFVKAALAAPDLTAWLNETLDDDAWETFDANFEKDMEAAGITPSWELGTAMDAFVKMYKLLSETDQKLMLAGKTLFKFSQ